MARRSLSCSETLSWETLSKTLSTGSLSGGEGSPFDDELDTLERAADVDAGRRRDDNANALHHVTLVAESTGGSSGSVLQLANTQTTPTSIINTPGTVLCATAIETAHSDEKPPLYDQITMLNPTNNATPAGRHGDGD